MSVFDPFFAKVDKTIKGLEDLAQAVELPRDIDTLADAVDCLKRLSWFAANHINAQASLLESLQLPEPEPTATDETPDSEERHTS